MGGQNIIWAAGLLFEWWVGHLDSLFCHLGRSAGIGEMGQNLGSIHHLCLVVASFFNCILDWAAVVLFSLLCLFVHHQGSLYDGGIFCSMVLGVCLLVLLV
jgi:fatty acid desaturase